jgi:UDP-glucose 4-epimerase
MLDAVGSTAVVRVVVSGSTWCVFLRVLVTGGAGFIGSHLVRALVSRGFRVRVLDDLSRGSLDSLKPVLDVVEFVRGDVRDPFVVSSSVRGVDVVVHLAALTDAFESLVDPLLYESVNVRGTVNVCAASKGVRVLVFASSAAVYGEPERLPVGEDHPLNPVNPYGASKVAGEAYVKAYSRVNGYRPVILRIFNVYGPGQTRSYAGVVEEFRRRIKAGKPLVIYGDGLQTRDFIHVSDVVEAIVKAVEVEEARGVYNIGSGRAVTVRELAELMARIAGRTVEVKHVEPRPGDIRMSQADIAKAERELKFKPRIELEEGLRKLLEEDNDVG